MSTPYRILDEPRPGPLARYTVNPTFPLLALMMAGTWLGLPWFVFNGFAMGSVTRRRELVLALVMVPGTLLLYLLLGLLLNEGLLTQQAARYAAVGVIVWKLTLGYVLFDLQQRSFALHEYYGGPVFNGLFPMVVGLFLRPTLLKALAGDNALLRALLG